LKPSRIIPVFITIAAHLLLLQFFSSAHRKTAVPEVVVPVQLINPPVLAHFSAKPPLKHSTKLPIRVTPPVAVTEGNNLEPAAAPAAPTEVVPVTISAVDVSLPELPPAPVLQSALLTTPPPSANYLLDVVRTEPNVANPYYGSGEIQWSHDDTSYTLKLEVGVNFIFATIRLYSVESVGSIGESGVKPKIMTESRRGRSATATHFNYDLNNISFSASTATIPMSEGAQDRATVLMQLASIGNADPDQFQPGREITIQVAEDKEASPFQFVVLKREFIETKLGHLDTWHIVRPPRPGLYTSRLDIWVAPELSWLPVQLRNTEANGAITTQTIRKIITGIQQ